MAGFESAQAFQSGRRVRNHEAVSHVCLSCVAQSLLQQAPCQGTKSERFAFANENQTVGQQLYSLTREAYQNLLHLV